MTKMLAIHGAGGKSGGGPAEAENTLFSRSVARIVDLIGEGEIGGPVDGLQSVFIDGVPIEAADGSRNIEGVTVVWRSGTADQAPLDGIPETEVEAIIGATLRAEAGVTHRVRSNPVHAVRVTIAFPSLVRYDDRGNAGPTSVSFTIETRAAGGSWSPKQSVTVHEKNTAAAELSWRVPLSGASPIDVRVTRVTPDSDSDRVRDTITWARVTEIAEIRQSYPHSAVVGITADAERYRSQLIRREYEVYGLIVQVPSNYAPDTRTYTGIWDGTFNRAWSDNPAWCAYHILTSRRFGLGAELSAVALSAIKWRLYEIAQWCDVPVPDGRGGTEARWRFNGVIAKAVDARRLLRDVFGAFRTSVYWGGGQIVPVHDAPADPVSIVAPANTVDGEMEVASARWSDRISAVAVSFSDPDDAYRQGVELVIDDDLIEKYGYRQKDVAAMHCTSRGQAQRTGRHILVAQEYESDTLRYRGGFDQASLRPGDVIRQHDPQVAGARLAGRIRGLLDTVRLSQGGVDGLALDNLKDIPSGRQWTCYYTLPSGDIESRDAFGVSANTGVVFLTAAPSVAPRPGAMAVLEASDVVARLWRIESVVERDDFTFDVAARAYHPDRYDAVERGVRITEPDLTLIPTGSLSAPAAVTISEHLYLESSHLHVAVTVAVAAAGDPRVALTEIQIWTPADTGYRPLAISSTGDAELRGATTGIYRARARYIAEPPSFRSPWREADITTVRGRLAPPAAPTNFLIDELPDGTRRYRWTIPADPDFAGVQLAYVEHVVGRAQPEWDDMTPMHGGILTADHFESTEPQRPGSYQIAVRSVDTSKEVSNPVFIVADLGPTRGLDVLLWECPSAIGWPGTHQRLDRSDDGRDALESNAGYTWADVPTWEDWASWAGGDGSQHLVAAEYDRGILDIGALVSFSVGWQADTSGPVALQIRVAATQAGLPAAAWQTANEAQTFTARWLQVRWRISGDGNTLLALDHLCWRIVAPSSEERLRDIDSANLTASTLRPGGRVLPTTLRTVTDVDLILQSVGPGWSWVLLDKSPPTVIIYDSAGNTADATIDAVLRGIK